MQITSLQLLAGGPRIDDFSAGLNVVYLASPDKRRLTMHAVQAAFGAEVEPVGPARVGLSLPWGRLTVERDEAGWLVRDVAGIDCTSDYAEKVRSWLPPDVVASVCVPRLGDPQALHETTYKVCGAVLAEEQRRKWEALLAELELAQPFDGHAEEVAALKEQEAELVAALPEGIAGPRNGSDHDLLQEKRILAQYLIRVLEKRLALAAGTDKAEPWRKRLARWKRRYQKIQARLAAIDRLADTAASGADPSGDERFTRLRAVRRRLAELHQRERQQCEYWLERVRSLIPARPSSSLLTDASQWLRELTGGEFTGVCTVRLGRETLVEQPGNKRVSCDVLSRAERVQVHLAVCLAALAAASRAGHRLPLVINDAVRQIPPARVRTAIELLRAHGRLYGQVVLLTSQPHVATLCRSLGVAVHNHTVSVQSTCYVAGGEAPALPTSVEEVWRQVTRLSTGEFPHAEAEPSVSVPPPAVPTRQAAPPPTTFDGTRQPLPVATPEKHCYQAHRGEGTDNRCFLQLSDPVCQLTWLPPDQISWLEKAAIHTVGAFLRVEAAELASRSGERGESAEQIRIWQAQARLLSEVPRLRPYDAQILVACGITTGEQLADIRPHELYRLVHTFLSTPEGARLVRRGTNEEIQRLTQWLRRMRQLQPATAKRTGVPSVADALKPVINHSDSEEALPGHGATAAALTGDGQTAVPCSAASGEGAAGLTEASETGEKCDQQENNPAQADPQQRRLAVSQLPGVTAAIAKRLEGLGIGTIADLLMWDAQSLCERLRRKRTTAATVEQWRQVAQLMEEVSFLRPHEAYLLVATGILRIDQLRASDPQSLFLRVQRTARSSAGRRLLVGNPPPTVEEVARWVDCARHLYRNQAA